MNLGGLVDWGSKTLALVDDPSVLEPLGVSAERVRAKLGWLGEFRGAGGMVGLPGGDRRGVGLRAARGVVSGGRVRVGGGLAGPPGVAGELREELIDFVRGEALKARFGERLPGTTEVLESCFGKLKALEDGQSKSGFTGLVLSLGAMVSTWTAESIGEALEQCRVRDLVAWCRKMLGKSVQSQRKQAYGQLAGAKEMG